MGLLTTKSSLLRTSRKLHRLIAIAVFVFFLLTTCTGILLGWEGTTDKTVPTDIAGQVSEWKLLDSLRQQALVYFNSSEYRADGDRLLRIDMRLDKGTVNFVFKGGEVLLAGKSGRLLRIRENEDDDFIKSLHDGSLVDKLLGTQSSKTIYTMLLGVSILLLVLSGLWLYYGPRIKKR